MTLRRSASAYRRLARDVCAGLSGQNISESASRLCGRFISAIKYANKARTLLDSNLLRIVSPAEICKGPSTEIFKIVIRPSRKYWPCFEFIIQLTPRFPHAHLLECGCLSGSG